jgi:hypothetical protein
MASRAQILRLEQRIEGLAQAAGAGATVDLFGWGDETEDEVIARALPYRPELAHTPRHLIRFMFFRWMTCDEAIGRGWETGSDRRHLASRLREGANGHKSPD